MWHIRRVRLGCGLAFTVLILSSLYAHADVPTADGYPNARERALVVLTNAARQEPQGWCLRCNDADACAAYPGASEPVLYDANGGRAARFHARHMQETPCFQHNSCCTLVTVDGQVQCENPPDPACTGCAPTSCAGTGFSARTSMFGFGANSENIAAGNSGVESTVCQWLRSPGHRSNMLNSGRRQLGPGQHSGPSCYGSYWVQNFGFYNGSIPRIPEAARIDDAWYALNLHHPGGADPLTAVVVEDGVCQPLQLEWGTYENGTLTHRPSASIGPGCHTYYFVIIDSEGVRHEYPSAGALIFGEGCGLHQEVRPEADCFPCSDGDTEACYDGPPATEGVGLCSGGVRTCALGQFGPCAGQVLPSTETCNGQDDDCNGEVDEGCEQDAGVPVDAASPLDAEREGDGGEGPSDDGGEGPSEAGTEAPPALERQDPAPSPGMSSVGPGVNGGCGCAVSSVNPGRHTTAWALILSSLVGLRVRRRRAPSPPGRGSARH